MVVSPIGKKGDVDSLIKVSDANERRGNVTRHGHPPTACEPVEDISDQGRWKMDYITNDFKGI